MSSRGVCCFCMWWVYCYVAESNSPLSLVPTQKDHVQRSGEMVGSYLPQWVGDLLHHELLSLKQLLTTEDGSFILTTIQSEKARRFRVWERLFTPQFRLKFPALFYFWKLQQQLGQSGVAVEAFISKLHFVVGDPLRAHSSDEYIEYITATAQNGPPVHDFVPDATLDMWRQCGHQLARVEPPPIETKLVSLGSRQYGPIKAETRNRRRRDRRKHKKEALAVARGNFAPTSVMVDTDLALELLSSSDSGDEKKADSLQDSSVIFFSFVAFVSFGLKRQHLQDDMDPPPQMPLFEEFDRIVPNIVGRTRSEQAFVRSSAVLLGLVL